MNGYVKKGSLKVSQNGSLLEMTLLGRVINNFSLRKPFSSVIKSYFTS